MLLVAFMLQIRKINPLSDNNTGLQKCGPFVLPLANKFFYISCRELKQYKGRAMGKNKEPGQYYLEGFYKRVQKECGEQGINCNLCFGRIHIYTKHEDFYFEPSPGGFVVMHQNIDKDGKRYGGYHVQEGCTARTPEGIVRYVAGHTKYRYTPEGRYRTDEELEAYQQAKETRKKQSAYQNWLKVFCGRMKQLCSERGWTFQRKNNFATLTTPYETFIMELATEYLSMCSKRCLPLDIKKSYVDCRYAVPVEADTIIQFISDELTVHNQEGYIAKFYSQVNRGCEITNTPCDLKGNRIYIYAETGPYNFDVVHGQEIEVFRNGEIEPYKTYGQNTRAIDIGTDLRNEKPVKTRKPFNWKLFGCISFAAAVVLAAALVTTLIILL